MQALKGVAPGQGGGRKLSGGIFDRMITKRRDFRGIYNRNEG